MFADPAVITVNGVAKSLVRINQDKYSSEYLLRSDTEEYRLIVRNTSYPDKRNKTITYDRHTADLAHTVFATPTTSQFVRHTYVVFENQRGDTIVNPVYVALGLLNYLSASSGANLTKLTNFES